MPTATLTLNVTEVRAEMAAFFGRLGVELQETGKAVAARGGQEIVARVEGHGPNIRRVDTHRYASSWAAAAHQASGRQVGDESAAEPGDALGSVERIGSVVEVSLESEVPYGSVLEYGSSTMLAGWHVQSTRENVDRDALAFLDPAVSAAWEG